MQKKKVFFFIDSLGGGGAERVVSVLADRLSEKGYDINIVMLWKRQLAYQLPHKVNCIYAEDMTAKKRKSFRSGMRHHSISMQHMRCRIENY